MDFEMRLDCRKNEFDLIEVASFLIDQLEGQVPFIITKQRDIF